MTLKFQFGFNVHIHSTRLQWAHTPVINWAVCLGLVVSSNPVEVREREEGVVALHLPIVL